MSRRRPRFINTPLRSIILVWRLQPPPRCFPRVPTRLQDGVPISCTTSFAMPRAQADQRVLSYMQEANRPFNVQNVADMMAQYGIKKPQVERSLLALAERGDVVLKVLQAHRVHPELFVCARPVTPPSFPPARSLARPKSSSFPKTSSPRSPRRHVVACHADWVTNAQHRSSRPRRSRRRNWPHASRQLSSRFRSSNEVRGLKRCQ